MKVYTTMEPDMALRDVRGREILAELGIGDAAIARLGAENAVA